MSKSVQRVLSSSPLLDEVLCSAALTRGSMCAPKPSNVFPHRAQSSTKSSALQVPEAHAPNGDLPGGLTGEQFVDLLSDGLPVEVLSPDGWIARLITVRWGRVWTRLRCRGSQHLLEGVVHYSRSGRRGFAG